MSEVTIQTKRYALFVALALAGIGIASSVAARKALQNGDNNKKRLKAQEEKAKFNNARFYKQLRHLLHIVLPSWRSREALLLMAHTGSLVLRTFLSLYVAHLDGALVRALVARKLGLFVQLMVQWMLIALPSSLCNAMIKYLESTLATAFRTRLTTYATDRYMRSEVYYRVLNLDDRVRNADQRLTEDVASFCTNLAHVHSQLSKPFLDVLLSSINLIALGGQQNLRRGAGTASTVIAGVVIYASATLLRLARPPLGALVAKQAALEGELRHVHARLIANAEQVGFYRGHKVEASHLMTAYHMLMRHMDKTEWLRVPYGTLESFLMKYVWSAAGLSMLAVPAFLFEKKGKMEAALENDAAEVMSARTGDFVTARKLLMTASDAIERMMLALKEVAQLAGYTTRVYEALEVFDDVAQGRYVKHATVSAEDNASGVAAVAASPGGAASDDVDPATPVAPGKWKDDGARWLERRGELVESDEVAFENVPILTPNGDLLVRLLNFAVKRGDHCLISGPNGCGKSSVFRTLGGLWPVYGGTVRKPAYNDMFYVPQQPYMSLGTLRDQIIYPDSRADMIGKGFTDEQLMALLERTHTAHVVRRESLGFDAVRDWKSALSGGLLQRTALARVLYHRPKFAILDECTSAVSIDVEGAIYQYMIDTGITLLTVTHRASLWKYHNCLLQFDGEGGYIFRRMDKNAALPSLSEEKLAIADKMRQLQQRMDDLDQQMVAESPHK